MSLAAWDACILYLSYNFIYLLRLQSWQGWSLGLLVITATWLSISYLIGRYSPVEGNRENTYQSRLAQSIIPAFVVLGLFIGHSWMYSVVDAETRFRGFLIPLMGLSITLSTIGQAAVSRLERTKPNWIIISDESNCRTLRHELAREQKATGNRPTLLRPDDVSAGSLKTHENGQAIAVGDISYSNKAVVEELLKLREDGKQVIPLLNWCEQHLQRIPPELISSEWLIQAEGFGLRPGTLSWRIKRLGDVLGATGLLLLTVPLVILSGLLIWFEDQGPVFYSQIRTGLFGRPIRIWKLRSMRTDAEASGAQWASRRDPRITNIGRLLRATRIDELPQLASVINGDLSLIGPRPERPEIEEELEQAIPHYRVRHWIRPGLSGWAQVCYPYGASLEDSRMKLSYDLYYLRNANVLLDFLITMKTIRLVIGAKGASPEVRQ